MNKNWNDRADRDLFFTILSVKAIGIISGAEWTTIGNHMRTMGYGFTNEGCRQHFQGLRRTQHKTAASANVVPGLPRVMDPTMNPITRRPGPGRGRPRKNARNPEQAGAVPHDAAPQNEPLPEPLPEPQDQQQFLHQQPQDAPQPQQQLPQQPFPPQEQLQEQQQQPQQDQPEPQPQIPQPPLDEPVMPPAQQEASPVMSPAEPDPGAVPTSMPVPVTLPAEEQVAEPLDLPSPSEEPDEHVAKRPRLEEEQTHETLDDDAVLALTGHESQPDSYPSPSGFEYGEA